MLRSTVRGETPTPLLALPCGSRSSRSVARSAAATLAARFTAVVVLPTPPFWFTTAITLAAGLSALRGVAPDLLIGRTLIARAHTRRQRAALENLAYASLTREKS